MPYAHALTVSVLSTLLLYAASVAAYSLAIGAGAIALQCVPVVALTARAIWKSGLPDLL